MPTNAIIHQFRFLRADDPFNPQWQDWSRCYEWAYALDAVAEMKPATLHNTGCGFDPFQLPFAEAINALVPHVLHSDRQDTPTFRPLANFRQLDIRQAFTDQFACVLAISYLEEIPPSWHPRVLANLWAQVMRGGRLILTCDVEREHGPSVSVPVLEAWVGAACERKEPLLTGLTSRLGARMDRPMKVVLLDLEKR